MEPKGVKLDLPEEVREKFREWGRLGGRKPGPPHVEGCRCQRCRKKGAVERVTVEKDPPIDFLEDEVDLTGLMLFDEFVVKTGHEAVKVRNVAVTEQRWSHLRKLDDGRWVVDETWAKGKLAKLGVE
jgi:hypothetical protein